MRFVFAFILIRGICGISLSQPLPDSSSYSLGLQLISSASTEEHYVQAAEFFRNYTGEHDSHWLAHYYAGLSYTLASHENQSAKLKDALIDEAQREVDKALEINPDEPEMLILQAFVFQARIQVNPEIRGLTYSMKAGSLLQKAKKASPDNPRAQLLLAYNTYYTPAIVGGGPANALPMFIKAREKFNTYRTSFTFAPQWGEQETIEMIDACRREIE